MKVLFESRDPEGALLRDLAVDRVRFVMRRLTWLVPRAEVRLMDVNGPRGKSLPPGHRSDAEKRASEQVQC